MIVGNLDITSVTGAFIALLIFCLSFITFRSFQGHVPQGLKKLPGPMGYPLIGNILELGNNPHLTLTRMRQKYGDVMKIHIGSTPILVISGLDTIKQALVKQGRDFMGRPNLYSFRHIINGQSLTFGRDSESVWRARKKLVQNALKTFTASPSPASSSTCLLEEHISKEVDYLVTKLQQVMKEKKSFDPLQYMVVSVANIICAICFGKRYSHDDQELLSIIHLFDNFEEIAAAGSPPDFFPILRYLPNPKMEKFKELNKQLLTFSQKYIDEHYKDFNEGNIRDITDSLILQSQGKKSVAYSHIQLSEEKIVNLVNDLIGASFDTMTTALSWCIMYLVAYPEIQKRIQEELDHTIGRERKPRLSDRSMLPYIEAFILEACRHSSFVPFAIPHCTTKDTVLNGFYIPKDMCVFINQWQVNHDETLWKNPSSFNPERFLTANGTEINREESEKVLIFGLGKRRCIGETIAHLELFLFLAALLHQLEFSISKEEKVNMTPRYGLALKLERCEHLQVKERLSKQSSE